MKPLSGQNCFLHFLRFQVDLAAITVKHVGTRWVSVAYEVPQKAVWWELKGADGMQVENTF